MDAIVSSLTAPGALDPLVVSVESGLVTLGVLMVFCTPLAWMLARGKLPFPRVWETGVLCSLLLPPLVIGLLLVFMVGPYTPVGELLATCTSPRPIPSSPWSSPRSTSRRRTTCSARSRPSPASSRGSSSRPALLGDRPRRVFRRVTLPLAAPGLAMSLSVAWARAMGAFGAVIIIAYHPMGIPLQIYTTLQETGLPSALPYALVLLVVALPLPLAAYIWSARAGRRRRG